VSDISWGKERRAFLKSGERGKERRQQKFRYHSVIPGLLFP